MASADRVSAAAGAGALRFRDSEAGPELMPSEPLGARWRGCPLRSKPDRSAGPASHWRRQVGAIVGDGLSQLVLAEVVIARDQGLAAGDEVGDAHALVPDVAARVSDISAQGHGIIESAKDGIDVEDVSILDGRGIAAREIDVDDAALGVLVDSFDADLGAGGGVGKPSGERNDLVEGLLAAQFVDSLGGDAAR